MAGVGAGLYSLAGCQSSAPPVAPAVAPTVATAGGQGVAAPSPTPAAPPAKYGGTFNWRNAADTPHLDPQQTGAAGMHTLGPGVGMSRLVKFKSGPGVEPGSAIPTGDLAESWEQADDLTYVFKLRQNAKWHNIAPVNGRAVTAEDIVYAYTRQRDLKVNASFLSGVSRMDAVDPRTVRMTLATADADFLATLCANVNKVIAREVVDQKGDLKEGPFIGTGPWILKNWERNAVAAMVRNPDYFIKGQPYLDGVDFLRIADDAATVSAFRGKNLLALSQGATLRDMEQIKAAIPEVEIRRYRSTGIGLEAGLNTTRAPFTDVRVRQAVSKAIDRQQLIDTVYFGVGWLAAGLTLPGLDWALPDTEFRQLYRRDVEGAKRLLAEAGFANGIDVEMSVPQYGAVYVTAAELVVAQLKEANIRATIKPVDGPFYTDRILPQAEHQMYVAPNNSSPSLNSDLLARFHSKGSRNSVKLNDPKLDALIERQAGMSKDTEGRERVAQDIQRAIVDGAAVLSLTSPETLYEIWSFVKDFSPSQGIFEYDYLTYLWLDR
jgi:ABC-type transport system substrate-binding protein